MCNCTATSTASVAWPARLNTLVKRNISLFSKRVLHPNARNVFYDVCLVQSSHSSKIHLFFSIAEARVARSARAIRVGNLRPGIVLYDETHPLGDDIGVIHTNDLKRKPDMLIIMGTSLKVHGLKKLVKDFARSIHGLDSPSGASSSKKPYKVIFVNKTPPGSEWADIIDYHVEGETDTWSNKVIEDWKKMRPSDWEIQRTLVDNDSPTAISIGLKAVKTNTSLLRQKAGKETRERENIPVVQADTTAQPIAPVGKIVPLSPSKRAQRSSHYDDTESSPSKRQSKSNHHHAMPKEERKILFAETTNKPKADVSLCDTSMLDLTDLKSATRKPSMRRLHGKPVEETSKMDITIQDLSMRDISIDVTEISKHTSKTTVEVVITKAKPTQRKAVAKRRVKERVVPKRQVTAR